MAALVDGFGRVHTDLRLSLTDRCNLRCTYCMPAEGLDWAPRADQLSDDEIVRVVGLMTDRLGVTTVRLTGGEPLLRRGLVAIVSRLHGLAHPPSLSMTTNGVGLDRMAAPLAAAGLGRVNVSLDSINPAVYAAITRRERLGDVIRGLEAASDAGLDPVKVNAVLSRDVNDTGVLDLLDWCLDRGYELRVIEAMPLDAQHGWSRDSLVSAQETLARLSVGHRLTALPGRGSAPAQRYLVDDGPRTVGVIASVTRPFCGDCDRLRLTADGQLRNCLFATTESDLRAGLREGISDDELERRIRATIGGKRAGHGIDTPDFTQPTRPMSAIGG